MRFAILFCSILGILPLQAQEFPSPTVSPAQTPSPTPSASPPRRAPLRFALPPLDGTISLGIYGRDGKLVRVLHREDEISDFTAGHDALETEWDGSDDHGNPLPNGKYSAHGYVVGDLKVEGIDYFFNDWVTDENSPHIRRVENVALASGQLLLLVTLPSGAGHVMRADPATGSLQNDSISAAAQEKDFYEFASPERLGVRTEAGKLALLAATDWQPVTWPGLIKPAAAALGKDGSVWVIDQAARDSFATELREFSRDGEILRSMAFASADPQPKLVRASTTSEQIYLLEETGSLQRLRSLTLVATKTDEAQQPVSDWKVEFEKKIIAHENFSLEQGKPVAASAAPPGPARITQGLREDPLQQDRHGKVELAIGIDENGSFLKTGDGLPLRTISDTPNLTRVLLARPNETTIDVFQDDGAVVEQFRISHLTEMIAFDCGDFELK
ncbi:hypothetical protein BH18VER2_BH18VER2_04350 [soil metagenome]